MASIARMPRPVALRLKTKQIRCAPISRIPAAVRTFSATSIGKYPRYKNYYINPLAKIVIVKAKYYTQDHEWIELSQDKKTGTIGISDYAAHALGDVVYVELPIVPLEAAAGDAVGAVESVKSASDINSPISCTIVGVNSFLNDKPGTINIAPEADGEGGGWIAKVEVGVAGVTDLEKLMDENAYKEFVSEHKEE
jgi:glycine cleavage system H protein